jgi:hypothetical protein
MSITNINQEAETSNTFEQFVVLFITVSTLVGPVSMLSVSVEQLWPLYLIASTWILGSILGVYEFFDRQTAW